MWNKRMQFDRKYVLVILYSLILLLSCTTAGTSGMIPDTGDPDDHVCNPHFFTDLGNGIILDNVTGLMWQKSAPSNAYTWRKARDYCSALQLGGFSDWRLPAIQELSKVMDCSIALPGPAIDTTFFPDTISSKYWSSTAGAYGLFHAWHMDFSSGSVSYGNIWDKNQVRAVRGAVQKSDFVDNGDGTITDRSTGLMWEKENSGETYTRMQASEYCENLTLGGKNDWRLPTRNELQSIVNYSRFNPSISMRYWQFLKPNYFPDGHFKIPHLWPGQNPPAGAAEHGLVTSF